MGTNCQVPGSLLRRSSFRTESVEVSCWIFPPYDKTSQQNSALLPDTWTIYVPRRLDCRGCRVTLKKAASWQRLHQHQAVFLFGAVNAYFFENRDCTGLNKSTLQRYIIHLEILLSFPVCDNNWCWTSLALFRFNQGCVCLFADMIKMDDTSLKSICISHPFLLEVWAISFLQPVTSRQKTPHSCRPSLFIVWYAENRQQLGYMQL